jgi:hypothetical protein
MPNGRCGMHGGSSPGAPNGNKNALKHGRYAADAIGRRREISRLVRAMKARRAQGGPTIVRLRQGTRRSFLDDRGHMAQTVPGGDG